MPPLNERLTFEEIAATFARQSPRGLTEAQQRLVIALFRLLARGMPVSLDAAAAAAGADGDAVMSTLRKWTDGSRDADDRVRAFWGLSLTHTAHRLTVGAADLFAWCAFDPLFLAPIVGRMHVATDDPITGATIAYDLDADGAISALSHPDSVVSFLLPERAEGDDSNDVFCRYVRQFESPVSGEAWTRMHSQTFLITCSEAMELAHHYVDRMVGDVLAAPR